MSNNQDIDGLTDKVLQSKKYKSLYKPTVKRIVEDVASHYPPNRVEKVVKRRLHQIWGAYFRRPNFGKLLNRIEEDLHEGTDIKVVLKSLLKLQTSTNERIPILKNFYSRIFSIAGRPQTIIEPACGLNALTYFWMGTDIEYVGFDVDQEEIEFINSVFRLAGVQNQARVELGDILAGDFKSKSDLVFLLKVMPILEHQQKGCTLEILRKLKCKQVVVSYPTRSISGKDKGMVDFYRKQFTNLVRGEPWKIEKLVFDTELVFVIRK